MSKRTAHIAAREAAHSSTTGRRGRAARTPYLVAADETSLDDLEMLVATLPLCATGRIFVEVPEASDVFPLPVPPRMTVTFLARAERSGAPGTGRACAAGAALTRAVTAWADEMLCAASADEAETAVDGQGTRVHVLASYLATADIVDHLTEHLGVDAEAIHTPERFGLQTAR